MTKSRRSTTSRIVPFTPLQGQYLAFIHTYEGIHGVRAGRGRLAATFWRDTAERSSDGCDVGEKRVHQSRRGRRAIHQIADFFLDASAA